jgi:hypothetical protein
LLEKPDVMMRFWPNGVIERLEKGNFDRG